MGGVPPAAGRGLAGRSHQSVSWRRLTHPSLPRRPDHLKDSDSPGGGAMSVGWKVAGTSKLFPSNQLLSSLQDRQHYSLRSLYIRPGHGHGARLVGTLLPIPLSGRARLKPSRRPRPGGSEGGRCRAKDYATGDQPVVWRGLRCLGDRSPPLHRPSLARGPPLNLQDSSVCPLVAGAFRILLTPHPASLRMVPPLETRSWLPLPWRLEVQTSRFHLEALHGLA